MTSGICHMQHRLYFRHDTRGTTINRTGPHLTAPDHTTASDAPDRTPTMTSYKNRVSALSAKK